MLKIAYILYCFTKELVINWVAKPLVILNNYYFYKLAGWTWLYPDECCFKSHPDLAKFVHIVMIAFESPISDLVNW